MSATDDTTDEKPDYRLDTLTNAERHSRLVKITTQDGTFEACAIHHVSPEGLTITFSENDDTAGSYGTAYKHTSVTLTVSLTDITEVTNDHDAESRRRAYSDYSEALAVEAAWKVISRSLNVMNPRATPLLDALNSEHSTLLGKLANTVLAAVSLRDGDGRLDVLNSVISENPGFKCGNIRKFSDIRQPFI